MDKVFAELMDYFETATWKDLCILQNLYLQKPSEEIAVLIRKSRKEIMRIRNTEFYADHAVRATKYFKNNAGRRIATKTE